MLAQVDDGFGDGDAGSNDTYGTAIADMSDDAVLTGDVTGFEKLGVDETYR